MYTVPCWVTHPSQVVGLTSELPSDVPEELYDRDAGPHEWNFYGKIIRHDKKASSGHSPFLDELTPGQSVGLLVAPNGQLHSFIDNEHSHEIATGLPVDTPLWGVAEVYANCTKIKSEIMSGESSGVVISPSQCVGEEVQQLTLRDS